MQKSRTKGSDGPHTSRKKGSHVPPKIQNKSGAKWPEGPRAARMLDGHLRWGGGSYDGAVGEGGAQTKMQNKPGAKWPEGPRAT